MARAGGSDQRVAVIELRQTKQRGMVEGISTGSAQGDVQIQNVCSQSSMHGKQAHKNSGEDGCVNSLEEELGMPKAVCRRKTLNRTSQEKRKKAGLRGTYFTNFSE